MIFILIHSFTRDLRLLSDIVVYWPVQNAFHSFWVQTTMRVTLRTVLRQWFKLKRRFKYHRRININFKGTGIFDLKRTQIYTHTFAWSEVIDKIEFWSCLYCVESVCITCGSEQDTLYKIIYTKMFIWCKTMCLIPHSLLAIVHV